MNRFEDKIKHDGTPTEGSWIRFSELEQTGKTRRFVILAGDNPIGRVQWFPRWRKYAFFPFDDTVYETDCLTDIIDFLKELMRLRAIERKNK